MICFQYQKKQEEIVVANKLNFRNYDIKEINFNTAKAFILKYEWIGNIGLFQYSYGLYIEEYLVAVVCYGPLVSPSKYKSLLNKFSNSKMLQLARGASNNLSPKWGPSKLISTSLDLLNKNYKINFVFAYADSDAGEIGTIYQSCNANYIGMTSPGGGKKYVINDKEYDPRHIFRKYGTRRIDTIKSLFPNLMLLKINPKHRYLFIIGGRIFKNTVKNHISHLFLPYPKRNLTMKNK